MITSVNHWYPMQESIQILLKNKIKADHNCFQVTKHGRQSFLFKSMTMQPSK